MKAFQTRFILDGIFIRDNQLWLIDNEILLKQNEREFSAFVLTQGEIYSEDDAKKKIIPFLTSSSIFIHKQSNLQVSGHNEINSINDLGKNLTVTTSYHIGTRTGLNKDMVLNIKCLCEKIIELNEKFFFLENASIFFYESTRYIIDKYKLQKVQKEQFINAFVVLESLFNESINDIIYKISIRISSLLKAFDHQATKTFDNMIDLYKIRNDIVHGSGKKILSFDDMETLQDYAEKCLISMYILCLNRRNKSKTDFKIALMREIDETLLNDEKQYQIINEIRDGLKNFNIS